MPKQSTSMLIPIRDHNPAHRFPFVTVGIILTNVIVFVFQLIDPRITYLYAAIPAGNYGRICESGSTLGTGSTTRHPR